MGTALTPTPISDEAVLAKCKEALNKWSSKLAFAVTRQLGDEAQLTAAAMYHAYTFRIETQYAHRKFELKKGGNPTSQPTPIDQVDMWDIDGAELTGKYDVPLPFTCYRERCDDCHGHGRVDCPSCKGSREVRCGNCGGRGEEKCSECSGHGHVPCPNCGDFAIGPLRLGTTLDRSNKRDFCRRCGGEGEVTCRKCGGSGTKTCSKCHGSGSVTCSKCKGRGEITCSNCDGEGYIPYQYHLIQTQEGEALELVWGDAGIEKVLDFDNYGSYPTQQLFQEISENDSQVGSDNFPDVSATFMDELMAKWKENFEKFDGVSDIYIHGQEVKFSCHDALVKYEYKYNGKDYCIWIDLTNGNVFEGIENGLMTESAAQIAEKGDEFAGKNPQCAIHRYAIACASTTNNAAHAKKIRKQLSLGSWLFRIAAGSLGGWFWSVFMQSQGAPPESGWYIMASMIAVDVLFAQKWFWLQLVGVGATFCILSYLLPHFYTPLIASDAYLQSYLASSALLFIGMSLLFARDFILRMKGGVVLFPIFGALVGGVTAPAMYLDFAADIGSMVRTFSYMAYGVSIVVILRTWKRYWVQNCGWIASKVPGGLARFETNMLQPRFWTTLFFVMLFGVIAYEWYTCAGPGVSMEAKTLAAERLLKNDQTREKGKSFLKEGVTAEYLPAIRLYAELQIRENPAEGYQLAVKAGDLGDAVGWRLQGGCLEHGLGVKRNLTDANARYTKAIELGDTKAIPMKARTDEIAKVWTPAFNNDKDAQYALALCYAKGNGIEKDEAMARSLLIQAADAGHVQAQLLVSDWLIKGVGGAADPTAGVAYCEKAAKQGEPSAIASLGYYYFDGKIIPQDYPKAVESFGHACEKGSGDAAYMLGHCYREGIGVETKDLVKAFKYFKLADERGNLPGTYALGMAYETGAGVGVDYTKALGAYDRASAADWKDTLDGKTSDDAKAGYKRLGTIGKYWESANTNGNAEAQYEVARCYAQGNGVTKNAEVAFSWYEKAAAQNHENAIVCMADSLFDGIGVPEDKVAAAKAFERGERAGDIHSCFRLGQCYENGYGFATNLTTAHSMYVKAAKGGYDGADVSAKKIELPAAYWDDAFVRNDATAQYMMGCCFSDGTRGVDKDDARAVELFKRSAEQGNPDALYMLYLCYRDGIGCEKNEGKATTSVFVAAEKAHPAALAVVGDRYRDGFGVDQDLTLALDYYKKATEAGVDRAKVAAAQIDRIGKFWGPAAKGDAKAEFEMGVCCRDGIQTGVDIKAAEAWFEKSAAKGCHDAEYALAKLLTDENAEDSAVNKRIVSILEPAAMAGHVKARNLLGLFLYTGKGVDEDYERAVALWKESAGTGDLESKCLLGDYYFTGKGVFNSGKDVDKAVKMWSEAADAGYPEASLRLGRLYANGTGMFGSKKDVEKAKQHLTVAADGGVREAMVMLAEILNASKSDYDKSLAKQWAERSSQTDKTTIPEFVPTVSETVDVVVHRTLPELRIDKEEPQNKPVEKKPVQSNEFPDEMEPGQDPSQTSVEDDSTLMASNAKESEASGSPVSVVADAESSQGNMQMEDTRSGKILLEIVKSEKVFREYMSLMHGKNKASRKDRKAAWAKYKGMEFTFRAKMKSVKKKNEIVVVDCITLQEPIVVSMKPDSGQVALGIKKGEEFYIRGRAADKRMGLFHVLELSDGEILE